MQNNLQRSTSHTGVSNQTSWGVFTRSNTLHHVDRQGRCSHGDNTFSEKYELITKETLNSLFQAIKNEDLLALTNLYHGIERLGLSQLQFRQWFIKKSQKDNQTPLIAAACKGNLEVVKFILETMFIGPQQKPTNNLEEEVENIDNNLVLESCCGESLTSLDNDFINFTPAINSDTDMNMSVLYTRFFYFRVLFQVHAKHSK